MWARCRRRGVGHGCPPITSIEQSPRPRWLALGVGHRGTAVAPAASDQRVRKTTWPRPRWFDTPATPDLTLRKLVKVATGGRRFRRRAARKIINRPSYRRRRPQVHRLTLGLRTESFENRPRTRRKWPAWAMKKRFENAVDAYLKSLAPDDADDFGRFVGTSLSTAWNCPPCPCVRQAGPRRSRPLLLTGAQRLAGRSDPSNEIFRQSHIGEIAQDRLTRAVASFDATMSARIWPNSRKSHPFPEGEHPPRPADDQKFDPPPADTGGGWYCDRLKDGRRRRGTRSKARQGRHELTEAERIAE